MSQDGGRQRKRKSFLDVRETVIAALRVPNGLTVEPWIEPDDWFHCWTLTPEEVAKRNAWLAEWHSRKAASTPGRDDA